MSLTPQDCAKVIYRYTHKNVQMLHFETTPLGDSPMGFLGEHNKLNITYKPFDNEVKHADFFLKTLPNGNTEHMAYINGTGVFQKEVLLYKNLLSEFQNYHKTQITPHSYLEGNNLIVLEDLSLNNYKVLSTDLDLQHWMSLAATIAHFHASTIIYEERRSTPTTPYRINTHHPNLIKEDTFVTDTTHPRFHSTKTTTLAVAKSMRLFGNYKPDKLLKFINNNMRKLVSPSTAYRNVVNHADLWRNNVMFKRGHTNETTCVLIDFQLARYAPAALDLVTALHINASTEFLECNFSAIVEEYYRNFAGCLKEHGLDSDGVMAYDVFMESVEFYKLAGLIEAAMFATIIFVKPQLAQKMVEDKQVFREFVYENRSKFVFEEFETNRYFRERYSDIMGRLITELEKWDELE